MPANSRWDLIQGFKGLKDMKVYFVEAEEYSPHPPILFL